MVDYAFDNYRQDLRLGGKKIFYDRSLCKKWVDKEGTEHAVPPDAVHRQIFYELPTPSSSLRPYRAARYRQRGTRPAMASSRSWLVRSCSLTI